MNKLDSRLFFVSPARFFGFFSAELESLHSDLRLTRAELLQATRGRAQLEGSVESLTAQVKSKEAAIIELKNHYDKLNAQTQTGKDQIYQKKIEQLKAEVRCIKKMN